jgi:lipid A 3-O-deacylase
MAIRHRQSGFETSRLLGLGLALAVFLQPPVLAAEPASNNERILVIGVLAHDHGPFSDHNEDGVDLNLEAQFAPLDIWGAPRPHLGVMANFGGDTSVAYAGLSFRLLHKDPVRCELYSDCGFGTRILPRFGLELGYRINPAASISLFSDHMSHKWIVAGENEGLDHTGLRYSWSF